MAKKNTKEQGKPNRLTMIFTAVVVLIGPLPLIIYGVSRVVDAVEGLAAAREANVARETWNNVDGEIVRLEIAEDKSLLGPVYWPEVDYAYVLNGVEHTGSRITFNDQPYRRRSEAQAVLDSFEVGSSITVFYLDVSHPEDAALSLSAPGGTVAALVMGLVITLIFAVPYGVYISQGQLKKLLGRDEG